MTDTPLTPDEFATLIRLAKKVVWSDRDTRRAIQAHHLDIVPCRFYSEIPTVEEVEHSFEFEEPDGPYNTDKIYNPHAMAEFLGAISQYAGEFSPPTDGDRANPSRFFWSNPAFSFSDAMAYYCVIRHARPNKVIEVGAGFSTLVALEAVNRNERGSVICVEPFPQPWLAGLDISLISDRVQSIGVEFFNESLSHGDILFIDSTHTVKAGSDCLHLYLRVLPFIDKNILVHVHDVYLPFPQPQSHYDRHIYWTEQYLLLAYLMDNRKTEVLVGSVYNSRFFGEAMARFMGGKKPPGGGSFWFRLDGRHHGS
jgi:hypothetical protein